jgi:hypothetical protein
MSDDDSLELKLAKLARDEAAADRKAAAADREAAEYERGQASRSLHECQVLEKSIATREQKLRELGEDALVARERAADAKLAEAQQLLASYDAAKHAAALKLAGQDATPAIGAVRDQEADVNDEPTRRIQTGGIVIVLGANAQRALPATAPALELERIENEVASG